MSAGAAAGAAARRAERKLVEHLREAGAVTSASASSIPDQRWMGKRVLSRLIRVGRFVRPRAGYYLEEAIYAAYRARRLRIVVSVVGTLAVVAAFVIWWASNR